MFKIRSSFLFLLISSFFSLSSIPHTAMEGREGIEVAFFNVGQGNCTVIKHEYHLDPRTTKRALWVVDAGSSQNPYNVLTHADSYDREEMGEFIRGWIEGYSTYNDVHFVLSHPDKDHYNMLPTLLPGLPEVETEQQEKNRQEKAQKAQKALIDQAKKKQAAAKKKQAAAEQKQAAAEQEQAAAEQKQAAAEQKQAEEQAEKLSDQAELRSKLREQAAGLREQAAALRKQAEALRKQAEALKKCVAALKKWVAALRSEGEEAAALRKQAAALLKEAWPQKKREAKEWDKLTKKDLEVQAQKNEKEEQEKQNEAQQKQKEAQEKQKEAQEKQNEAQQKEAQAREYPYPTLHFYVPGVYGLDKYYVKKLAVKAEDQKNEQTIKLHTLNPSQGHEWEPTQDCKNELKVGDLKVKFLNKTFKNSENDADKNANSLVVLFSYGQNSVLLTGDAEKRTELEPLPQATILQASHHGAHTHGSNSSDLIDKVKPKYIVFSAPKQSQHSHPSHIVVARAIEYFSKPQQPPIPSSPWHWFHLDKALDSFEAQEEAEKAEDEKKVKNKKPMYFIPKCTYRGKQKQVKEAKKNNKAEDAEDASDKIYAFYRTNYPMYHTGSHGTIIFSWKKANAAGQVEVATYDYANGLQPTKGDVLSAEEGNLKIGGQGAPEEFVSAIQGTVVWTQDKFWEQLGALVKNRPHLRTKLRQLSQDPTKGTGVVVPIVRQQSLSDTGSGASSRKDSNDMQVDQSTGKTRILIFSRL